MAFCCTLFFSVFIYHIRVVQLYSRIKSVYEYLLHVSYIKGIILSTMDGEYK